MPTHSSNLAEVRQTIAAGVRANVGAATLVLHAAVVREIAHGPGRSGREYTIPGTDKTYTASAPGQPPAVRTGRHLNAWDFEVEGAVGRVGNPLESAGYLERGTSRMEPRPALKPAFTKNRGEIERALQRPIK